MRVTTCAAIIAALFLSSACGSKKELDGLVEKLRTAVEADDYAGFRAISDQTLVDDFPEVKFHALASAVAMFGSFKDRTMHGINVKSGAPSEGRYTLDYENGEIELKIRELNGKLVGFNFEGEDFVNFYNKAVFGKFEVKEFVFLDGDKARTSNVFAKGEKVRFRMMVTGVKLKDKNAAVRASMKVKGGGSETPEKVLVDDIVKIDNPSEPAVFITGSFDPPGPGPQELVLAFVDKHADAKLEHSQAYSVRVPE